VDVLLPNLVATPTFVRVGEKDRSVHPWYSRRALRLLRKHGAVDGSFEELSAKEHWCARPVLLVCVWMK
jgi:hypothetical protein